MHDPDNVFFGATAVVAVPVRDEAERIADCLTGARARQDGPAPGVVLLVNNTDDATHGRWWPTRRPVSTPDRRDRASVSARAGIRRRSAAAGHGACRPAGARPGVPLLCTDADGRVAPDWLEANLYYLRHGADAVFGRAIIDPVEAERIPPALHEAIRNECAYAAALDEIAHLIDPEP